MWPPDRSQRGTPPPPPLLDENGDVIDYQYELCLADETDVPVSRVLWILVDDKDLNDQTLLQHSIADLIDIFFQEFESDSVQGFAMNIIMGYVETQRLKSRNKRLAAFAVLLGVHLKTTKRNRQHSIIAATIVYCALKFGSSTPIRAQEGFNFTLEDLYLLSRFLLVQGTSTVWFEKLGIVIHRWVEEYESLISCGASIHRVVMRDLQHILPMFEVALIANMLSATESNPPDFDATSVNIEKLIQSIDRLALNRLEFREKLMCQHRNLIIGECLKKLVPDWVYFDRFFAARRQTYMNLLLDTLIFPMPNATFDEMKWILPTKRLPPGSLLLAKWKPPQRLPIELDSILEQAFKEALTIEQRKELVEAIRVRPIWQFHNVAPDTLQLLVENNPIIAVEVLLKVIRTGWPGPGLTVEEFYDALITMEMSVQSMEVINLYYIGRMVIGYLSYTLRGPRFRLTSAIQLPKDFLYLYISTCIRTCEKIQDIYLQNRLIRLLCVFLQSLIRNKHIDIQDIYVEVIVFLVSFSRIREAAALFRLIRHVEAEDAEAHNVIAKQLEDNQELAEATKQLVKQDKEPKPSTSTAAYI